MRTEPGKRTRMRTLAVGAALAVMALCVALLPGVASAHGFKGSHAKEYWYEPINHDLCIFNGDVTPFCDWEESLKTPNSKVNSTSPSVKKRASDSPQVMKT